MPELTLFPQSETVNLDTVMSVIINESKNIACLMQWNPVCILLDLTSKVKIKFLVNIKIFTYKFSIEVNLESNINVNGFKV